MAKGHGHKLWIIPDGYIATTPADAIGPSGYVTHESVCILNDGDEPAQCTLDVFGIATRFSASRSPSAHSARCTCVWIS